MNRIKLKYNIFYLPFFLLFFTQAFSQIEVQNELVYPSGKSLYLFSNNHKFGIGKDTATVELNFDSIVLKYNFRDLNIAILNGKWGTIGDDNKVKIPLQYDSIVSPDANVDYIFAKMNGKWGTVDEDNQVGVKFKYDKLIPIHLQENVIASKNGKFGIVHVDDKTLVPFEYDTIMATVYSYKENGKDRQTFIVVKNGKYGLINNKNKMLLLPVYDSISNWIEYGPDGYYIKQNGKLGYSDLKGKVLFPCQYDRISYEMGIEKFSVQKDGKWGLIDKENKVFLPIAYSKLYVDDWSWLLQDNSHKGQIVVEDINQIWYYLSLKDGSSIAENVPKDSVLNRYSRELFTDEIIEHYKAKYKNGYDISLDTFSKNIVDYIIQSKANTFVDFPELHKAHINFEPRIWTLMIQVSKIRNYLQTQGFNFRWAGSYVDSRKSESLAYLEGEQNDCKCELALTLYPTYKKDEYKIVESLKCKSNEQRQFKLERRRNL